MVRAFLLQPIIRQFATCMKNAQSFHVTFFDTVRYHIRKMPKDKLASPIYASWPTKIRELRQQFGLFPNNVIQGAGCRWTFSRQIRHKTGSSVLSDGIAP